MYPSSKLFLQSSVVVKGDPGRVSHKEWHRVRIEMLRAFVVDVVLHRRVVEVATREQAAREVRRTFPVHDDLPEDRQGAGGEVEVGDERPQVGVLVNYPGVMECREDRRPGRTGNSTGHADPPDRLTGRTNLRRASLDL